MLNTLLLALIAYAPWHDAVSLGQRPEVSGVSSGGIANFVWFVLTVPPLLYRLATSYLQKSPTRVETLVFVYLGLNLFHVRQWDHFAKVMEFNSIWLCVFLLVLLRSSFFKPTIDFLSKHGLVVLTISLGLAISLPFVIQIHDYDIFKKIGAVYRFRGWLGEGQPIGFCGAILGVWSGVELFRKGKLTPSVSMGILVSFLAIQLNVLRISLITVAACYALLSAMALRKKSAVLVFAFLALFGVSTASFFTGQFYIKNTERGYLEDDGSKAVSGLGNLTKPAEVPATAENKNPLSVVQGLEQLKEQPYLLDRIIISNNRGHTYQWLLNASKDHRTFGLGSGAAPRILAEMNAFAPHPGNDYIRILVEQGVVGLILFLLIFLLVAYQYRGTLVVAVLASIAVILTTDAVLIIPTFGYAPLLVIAWIASTFSTTSLTSGQSDKTTSV